ncbi:ASPIC/UnbV domain-containing protein, partial [Schlesneria sp.]|uniref:ASPIC/UnbV domain-containing protein n=1 Tax=Schlesneria sp. TaxID=2762018 RepID=UPI002F2280BD
SYLSTSDRSLLFGLGKSTQVDRLEVHWPTGQTTSLASVSSCQRILVVEDTSEYQVMPVVHRGSD